MISMLRDQSLLVYNFISQRYHYTPRGPLPLIFRFLVEETSCPFFRYQNDFLFLRDEISSTGVQEKSSLDCINCSP